MADEACGCQSIDTEQPSDDRDETPGVDRWIEGPAVVDEPLPADLQTALGRFLGDAPVETLAEFAASLDGMVDTGDLTVDNLCHADEATPHRGVVDGQTYHFQCFYDAVVLAELVESPVDVSTESPDGTPVTARASGDGELSVTPPDAVMSFGIARDAGTSGDGALSFEDAYANICPFVRAFPDRAAYESWATATPARTVAVPLSDATALATLLAGDVPDADTDPRPDSS